MNLARFENVALQRIDQFSARADPVCHQPKPFVRTKSADASLAGMERVCLRIANSDQNVMTRPLLSKP